MINFWARIKFYSSKWLWEKLSLGSVRILESFVMKSINMEGKRDFGFIREMRVSVYGGHVSKTDKQIGD